MVQVTPANEPSDPNIPSVPKSRVPRYSQTSQVVPYQVNTASIYADPPIHQTSSNGQTNRDIYNIWRKSLSLFGGQVLSHLHLWYSLLHRARIPQFYSHSNPHFPTHSPLDCSCSPSLLFSSVQSILLTTCDMFVIRLLHPPEFPPFLAHFCWTFYHSITRRFLHDPWLTTHE